MEVKNLLKEQAQQQSREAARRENLMDIFDMCFELNYPQISQQRMATCLQLYSESKKITERAFGEYVKSQNKRQ